MPSAMGGGCTVGQAGGGQRDERAGWVRRARVEVGACGGGTDPPEGREKEEEG